MLNQARAGLIVRHGVRAVDLFGVAATAPGPFNERPCPLNRRSGRNRPPVILDHHQNRQLMNSRLPEERVEVIGCRAAITCGKHDDFTALLPFQTETNAAPELCQSAYFADGVQGALAPAAVLRVSVAARAH